MRSFRRVLSLWLTIGLLPFMYACKPSVPEEADALTDSTSPPTEEVIEPERDVYEDLSVQVPAYTNPGTKSCTLRSEGTESGGAVTLDFTVLNGAYVITPTKIKFSCHDITACDSCGYVDTADGGAYLMSSEGLDQGGITVTLASPLPASAITGMTMTFKTTAEATSSSMRILPKEETNNAAFINSCGSMSGATQEWQTVDLGVKDFSELADSDGYVRSFQMYFRNKNKTDCYVKNIRFSVNSENYLAVDEVTGNHLYSQGAVEAVASVITSRFAAANICADVTVTGVTYKRNSSNAAGTLKYKALVTLADGTVLQKQHTATIPPVSGIWLDATDGKYGSSHDSLGQWQDTFDPAGILFLTDNRLSCAEGMDSVEYAVVSRDTPYDSEDTVWFAPQMLAMNDDGFAHLLINAFLDYGDALKENEAYRLLVRGVSKRDNYILHVDIPFVYSPLSKDATAALAAAVQTLRSAKLVCDGSISDKADAVQQQINALINDGRVIADVQTMGEGVHSMRMQVTLRYEEGITAPRLPVYTLDGETLNDVYNHNGTAFFCDGLTVSFDDLQSSIELITPYDGQADMILAADCIYAHAKAPLAVIQNANYGGYVHGEHCTPPPVRLEWRDANGSEGKTYTVAISENPDMSGAREYTVTGSSLDVYNLNIGTKYYWQIRCGNDASLVQTFTTLDGYPRFLKLDGVSNVRDIGGYVTVNGKRVRQDLAYRSAQLESITDSAREIALNELHIRTDLDLRGGSTRPLGNTVQHISVPMQWYEHIFEADMHEHVRKTMSTFAYEENYPIIFHCSMGRDRTGTTTFLLLGLLGVEEDTLRHEYYASFFSQQGGFDEAEFPLLIINMNRLTEGLNEYGNEDSTLSERIEAFLLDTGVTPEEIRSIRNIWLET